MMKKKSKNQKGYAILFTVVVISIITMISIGLANTAFKQMILSGVARDSTIAFYEADLGSECALYADNSGILNSWGDFGSWTCSGRALTYTKSIVSNKTTYTIIPDNNNPNPTGKCFDIEIIKTQEADYISTNVESNGYNLCDKGNLRTVERTLEINY